MEQTYDLDTDFNTRRWHISNPAEHTAVTASRTGNKIQLKGLHKGKSISKSFRLKIPFWNQTFNIGLEPFVISSSKQIKFCLVI